MLRKQEPADAAGGRHGDAVTAQKGFNEGDGTAAAVRSLLCASSPGCVHLVGIGGVGMAGVALLLKSRGFTVTGCDRERGNQTAWLEAHGIAVSVGHDVSHIDSTLQCVIRTAAVTPDSPEIVEADRRGVPVFTRGRVLPVLLEGKRSIAVSGTHGKTTTTTFTALLLSHAGLNPSWCIGGEPPGLDGVAGAGSGDAMVVEADESDGTIAFYHPDVAVITNVEFDHMEHFRDVEAFEACFRSFAGNARRVVYCGDDPRAAALLKGASSAVSYGLSQGTAVRGRVQSENAEGSVVDVECGGQAIGQMNLAVPGRHNVLNALAAIAACRELGVDCRTLLQGVGQLRLPGRRFETVVNHPDLRVISDYGHHPTEIAALVRTASLLAHRRITAVFQPHRYTRTAALGADFPGAFAGINELVLLPIYEASEQPVPGGDWWDLYAHFRSAAGKTAERVFVADSIEQAWAYFRYARERGDLFLVVGAGSVGRMAQLAREAYGGKTAASDLGTNATRLPALSPQSLMRQNEPLAAKTTLGVGGSADVWVDVGNEEDLAVLHRWARENKMPLNVVGGGSNLLVSDLGVRGVVARLSGEGFRTLSSTKDGITVGAGVKIHSLLSWMEGMEYPGLEFLAGIPGTVGGALRMNAGAWGHAICDVTEWIRCLNPDGSVSIVSAEDIGAGYRTCRALDNRIALGAGLKVIRGSAGAIREAMRDARGRRAWMSAARTAGSVFKNPIGGFAGELIERTGLKGFRLGGAEVSTNHANVIVAGRDATASDVLSLVRLVQDRVRRNTGTVLEPEIRFLA